MDYKRVGHPEADSAVLSAAAISVVDQEGDAGNNSTSGDKNNNNNNNSSNGATFEKYCFFIGFLFPPAWFIGSSDCCGCRDTLCQGALIWKKRCRIAATLVLTVAIVTAAIVMILNPSLFGLRSGGSSATQTSSSSDTAIRPGVPSSLNGTSSWGDTIAGVRPST